MYPQRVTASEKLKWWAFPGVAHEAPRHRAEHWQSPFTMAVLAAAEAEARAIAAALRGASR